MLSPDKYIKTLSANQKMKLSSGTLSAPSQSVFGIKMNPSNGILLLKIVSKGDQLKIKLANLKFPKNDNLENNNCINLVFEIGSGDEHGSKANRRTIEPVRLWVLLGCNF